MLEIIWDILLRLYIFLFKRDEVCHDHKDKFQIFLNYERESYHSKCEKCDEWVHSKTKYWRVINHTNSWNNIKFTHSRTLKHKFCQECFTGDKEGLDKLLDHLLGNTITQ